MENFCYFSGDLKYSSSGSLAPTDFDESVKFYPWVSFFLVALSVCALIPTYAMAFVGQYGSEFYLLFLLFYKALHWF